MSKYIINGCFPDDSKPIYIVHNTLYRFLIVLYRDFSNETIDSGIRLQAIDILMSLVYVDSFIFSVINFDDYPQLTKQNIDFLHEVLKSSKYSRKRQVSRK